MEKNDSNQISFFEVNSSSNVKLSSITVPKNYANKKYEEIESIPFSEMTISEKFVPIVYKKRMKLLLVNLKVNLQRRIISY